ncbi:MAG TPA: hypothetical protein PK668_11535 [Myxococcota bacterium]|nr:hypothetical protein [Myxococcota bacterium]HRY93201.1 hypothetical protein [Myxococcota bacterium]
MGTSANSDAVFLRRADGKDIASPPKELPPSFPAELVEYAIDIHPLSIADKYSIPYGIIFAYGYKIVAPINLQVVVFGDLSGKLFINGISPVVSGRLNGVTSGISRHDLAEHFDQMAKAIESVALLLSRSIGLCGALEVTVGSQVKTNNLRMLRLADCNGQCARIDYQYLTNNQLFIANHNPAYSLLDSGVRSFNICIPEIKKKSVEDGEKDINNALLLAKTIQDSLVQDRVPVFLGGFMAAGISREKFENLMQRCKRGLQAFEAPLEGLNLPESAVLEIKANCTRILDVDRP